MKATFLGVRFINFFSYPNAQIGSKDKMVKICTSINKKIGKITVWEIY
jgi:hypothetical protein